MIVDIFLIIALVFGFGTEITLVTIPLMNSSSTINVICGIAFGLLTLCVVILAICKLVKDIKVRVKHHKRKYRW